jgi:uncharacterized secreted protein with C-terminal beta-propeller domain
MSFQVTETERINLDYNLGNEYIYFFKKYIYICKENSVSILDYNSYEKDKVIKLD